MQGRRKLNFRVRLAMGLFGSLLMAASLIASFQIAAEENAGDGEGKHPQQFVRLNWTELKQTQQVVSTSMLELIVENVSPFALTARVHVSADTGTSEPPATMLMENVTITAGRHVRLRVPITSLRQIESLRGHSGGLRATALACLSNAKNGSDCQSVSAPEWFLHVDSLGALRVYDAPTLSRFYRSGELSLAGLPGDEVRDEDEAAYPNRAVQWIRPGSALATPAGDGPATIEGAQQ